MFYIFANGKTVYQPMTTNLTLLHPKLTLEAGKAGSLQFDVPPNHQYYNYFTQFSTEVVVEMDDVEIFRGRVLTNNRNFNNVRTVYCEGNLAYLVDSVQKAERYDGTVHDLFAKIIDNHNSRVEPQKQFEVGEITVEDLDILLTGSSEEIEDAETGKFDYKQIAINASSGEWQNTFDFIESCLTSYTGGYLRTRRENGVNYIDLLQDYNTISTQEIEFGKNMLDLNEEVTPDDLFTVLIPLGDGGLTIESVNDGSDELIDEDAVATYGRIIKTHVFDGVTNPETLLENAEKYMELHTNVPVVFTVKAVDLHMVDRNTSPIYVGNKVHVNSMPHGLVDILTVRKIEYDLEKPENNIYTFGNEKQSLTERYRKDKQQDSKGGGGGGGGGAAEVVEEEAHKELEELFKAWINVNDEAGHIDLGTLYEKYKEAKTILSSSCGISLDAPSGNINIKTMRQDFDEMGNTLNEQSAYIDLLNTELNARIDLITSRTSNLENSVVTNQAEILELVNENTAQINSNTSSIVNLKGSSDAMTTQINQLSDDLRAQIELEASHKSVLDGKITLNSTKITQVANDLSSQITLEAQHNSAQSARIDLVAANGEANSSAIRLKADKITLDTAVAEITGRLDIAESHIDNLSSTLANIDTLIADKIEAADLNAMLARLETVGISKTLRVGQMLTSPLIHVTSENGLYMDGKPVATRDYVNTQLSDYATQSWVNGRGFLTEIPSALNVTSVKATDKMTIGVQLVATQYWCMSTKKFATQDWVLQQLESYAAADHTHAWSAITEKPTTFKPASHRHSFSGSASVANGHTHTVSVNGTPYTTSGASTNITHKIEISGNTGYN